MLRRNPCPHIITVLILATMALVSYQSSATSAPVWDTCLSACVAPTVTADGRVRVIITKAKPKLHLPKPQRPVIRLSVDDDDSDYYNELSDLQVGYRRPELVDQTARVHDDISDEIKIRLVLARKRALEAYNRKWV
jgi:hypothetical protein